MFRSIASFILLVILFLVANVHAVPAPNGNLVRFLAQHQPLGRVLETIQQQSGIRLVYVNSFVDSFAVYRKFDDTPYEAVRKSLLGTPLDFIQKTDNLWIIVPRSETIALPAVIEGRITDIYLGEPIAGANIYVENSGNGTTSGADGTFELTGVPPGRQLIQVRRIGYNEVEMDLLVRGNQRKRLEIALEPRPVPTPEVVVEERIEPMSNRPILQTQTIGKLQMETPPVANDGEIFEIIHQQPGVSRRDMDDVFPHIEGGSATEVAVELDGMPINVPTFGQNQRSVFAASIIENLTLHRSGYGIEYGDALSGIIALETPDVEDIPRSIYTSASLTGLTFNYKKKAGNIGVTGVWRNGRFANDLRFDRWQGFDLFNKLEYKPAQAHSFTILTLVSRGSFVASNSLESNQLFSQNLGLRYDYKKQSADFSALVYDSKLNEQQKESGFRLRFVNQVNPWLKANSGLEYTNLTSHGTIALDSLEAYKVVRDQASPDDPSGNFYLPVETDPTNLFNQHAEILTPYFGVTFEKPLWELTVGTRFPVSFTSEKVYSEPRSQLTLKPAQTLNLVLSKGLYYQFTDRSYASEAKSGDNAGRGEFIVKTSDRQPSKASHFRTELAWQPAAGFVTSVAYFNKDYEFRDRSYLSRINRWFWMLPLSAGKSKGYEYWFAKTNGHLRGWLSYTLNNQTYESADGTVFRPYFNRDKILNITMAYDLTNSLQIKGQYLRATGYPARDWGPDRVVISSENTPEVFAQRFLLDQDRYGSTRQYGLGLTWHFNAFARENILNLVATQRYEQSPLGLESDVKLWASIVFAN